MSSKRKDAMRKGNPIRARLRHANRPNALGYIPVEVVVEGGDCHANFPVDRLDVVLGELLKVREVL
jgi:hypothetical protein